MTSAASAAQPLVSHSGGARAAEQVVHGSGGGGSASRSSGLRSNSNGSGGAPAVHADLSAWLASVHLAEFEAPLLQLGAANAYDVKLGFEEGLITREGLAELGMKTLRAARLEREAKAVSRGYGGGEGSRSWRAPPRT